jgi:ferredoxin
MNVSICPINPPGHDWENGLTCRWCNATRTTSEAIVSQLASRRGGNPKDARALRNAFAADVLHGAVEAATIIHAQCDLKVCTACRVRRDILDVLRSVADVLAEDLTAQTADNR